MELQLFLDVYNQIKVDAEANRTKLVTMAYLQSLAHPNASQINSIKVDIISNLMDVLQLMDTNDIKARPDLLGFLDQPDDKDYIYLYDDVADQDEASPLTMQQLVNAINTMDIKFAALEQHTE